MIARWKLKGIDGNPHKQWSMWFNATIRAKFYQSLHIYKRILFIMNKMFLDTGVAWLSTVRVVKCLVRSLNERNPYF